SMAASICSSADARPFCQGARNPRALLSGSTACDDQRAGRDRQDRHHRAQVREAEVRDLDQSVKDEPDTQEELTEVLLHEGTAFRKSEGQGTASTRSSSGFTPHEAVVDAHDPGAGDDRETELLVERDVLVEVGLQIRSRFLLVDRLDERFQQGLPDASALEAWMNADGPEMPVRFLGVVL